MSERMTPEREHYLRHLLRYHVPAQQMLAELDAVRAECDRIKGEFKEQTLNVLVAAEVARERIRRIEALEAALRRLADKTCCQCDDHASENCCTVATPGECAHCEAGALLSPGEKPPTPEPTSVVDLEKWRKLAFSLCDSRHWSRTPLNRLGVHVEEAVELSTAVRGKGGDVEEEAGDALFTLLAMIPPEFSLAGVFARNVRKVEALFSAPVGQNHEEVEPPTPEPDGGGE